MHFLFLLCSFFCSLFLFSEDLLLLPQADKQKIVLRSKVLSIQGPKFPFNASITFNRKGGYWLFFREDLEGRTLSHPHGARIGAVALDQNFSQVGEPIYPKYPTLGHCVEDPRSFWVGEDLYVLYYMYPRPNPVCPCLIKVDQDTLQPLTIQLLKNRACPEKNWVPLIQPGSSNTLTCLRTLYPGTLATVDLMNQTFRCIDHPEGIKMKAPKSWKWGTLSGGTQAELVKGRFLSFFHSWFSADNGKRIYVMGACTFESTFPYRMTAISPHPILFKELYSARALNQIGDIFSQKWAAHIEKVIFPCGFVVQKTDSGRTLVHLSCGENDNSIRIITFDQEKLLASLIPVKE